MLIALLIISAAMIAFAAGIAISEMGDQANWPIKR